MPLYAIDPADRARYPKTLALMMNGPREAGVAGVIDRSVRPGVRACVLKCVLASIILYSFEQTSISLF